MKFVLSSKNIFLYLTFSIVFFGSNLFSNVISTSLETNKNTETVGLKTENEKKFNKAKNKNKMKNKNKNAATLTGNL